MRRLLLQVLHRYFLNGTADHASTKLVPLPYSRVSLPCFLTHLGRERSGPKASTLEAVANVRKCAKKECLFSGLPGEKQCTRSTTSARKRGCG